MSLREFGKRMRELADNMEANVEQVVRDAALTVDRVLVLRTPVDTGRARSNWIVTIDAPSGEMREPTDPETLTREAATVIAGFQLGSAIFLTNNLPYIRRLNDGYSAQAPAGFVEEAVELGTAEIRRAKIL